MHFKKRPTAGQKLILFLIMLFMMLLTGKSVAANAATKTEWNPETLRMDVPIGGMASQEVSFTVNRNTGPLRIEVVPALARYMTVEPSFIADGAVAGEAVTLTISVSFDKNFPGKKRAGVMHVRSGNSTLANPLNVQLVAASAGYTITGNVFHETEGLEGVTVNLSGVATRTVETDNDGAFSFSGLLEGEYTVSAVRDGYWIEPEIHTVIICEFNGSPHLRFNASKTLVSIAADPPVIRQGESTSLFWLSANADTCTIEPDIGDVLPNGTIDVSPSESTTYTISATGPAGTVTESVTVIVIDEEETLPVEITIISPENSDMLNRTDAMVRGVVENLGDEDFGLSVNATALNEIMFDMRMPANVHGNVFAANNIPLVPGINIITVTAMDSGMNRIGEAAVEVYSEPGDHTMEIRSDRESGISPLEAVIDINASFNVIQASVACSGPGAVNIVEFAPDRYEIQMAGPGIYYCSAEVVDPDENILVDEFAFSLTELENLDNLLRGIWRGMKAALENGDIQGALFYFDDDQKDLYSDIFAALSQNLPEIAATMNDIEMIAIRDNFAKYQTRKDESYGDEDIVAIYNVYFIKTPEGFWKIYRY